MLCVRLADIGQSHISLRFGSCCLEEEEKSPGVQLQHVMFAVLVNKRVPTETSRLARVPTILSSVIPIIAVRKHEGYPLKDERVTFVDSLHIVRKSLGYVFDFCCLAAQGMQ